MLRAGSSAAAERSCCGAWQQQQHFFVHLLHSQHFWQHFWQVQCAMTAEDGPTTINAARTAKL
jgi:hypothetical protein